MEPAARGLQQRQATTATERQRFSFSWTLLGLRRPITGRCGRHHTGLSVPIAFLPFDGWTPSGSYFGEGWVTAPNLYPASASWRPWRRLIPETNNVGDGPMLGGHVHVWNSGIGASAYRPDGQTIFAGSSRRLYTVDPATGIFTDVSKAALYRPA